MHHASSRIKLMYGSSSASQQPATTFRLRKPGCCSLRTPQRASRVSSNTHRSWMPTCFLELSIHFLAAPYRLEPLPPLWFAIFLCTLAKRSSECRCSAPRNPANSAAHSSHLSKASANVATNHFCITTLGTTPVTLSNTTSTTMRLRSIV
jgi:hypothetical protein